MKYDYSPLDCFFLPENTPGLEAIAFQTNSKLGSRLTELFQTGVDWVEAYDENNDTSVDSTRLVKSKSLYGFFDKEIVPKFAKIVKEETGLVVEKFVTCGKEQGLTGLFAVYLGFKHDNEAEDLMTRATGSSDTATAGKEKIRQDMMDMVNMLDLEKGKLTNSTYGSKKETPTVDIYFDVNMAFMLKDYLPATITDGENMTAREIAAILMHEIGHAMTFIEHSADLYVVRQRLNDVKYNLAHETDLTTLTEKFCAAIGPIAQFLSSFKSDDKVATKVLNSIGVQATAAIRRLEQEVKDDKDTVEEAGIVSEVAGAVGDVAGAVLRFIYLGIVSILLAAVFWGVGVFLINELARASLYADNLEKHKNSDFNVNYNNSFLMERWADEFVSRQGYGDDLASGLTRLIRAMDYATHMGEVNTAAMRQNAVYGYLTDALSKVLSFTLFEWAINSFGYEETFERVHRLCQNQYAFFKKAHLDGQLTDDWYMRLKRLEELREQHRNKLKNPVTDFASKVLKDFLLIPNWYYYIKNGQYDREYEKLQNQLDDISNNPLYAASYGLKRR